MLKELFDIAVLIGRFQPFHNGHAGLLRQALAEAGRVQMIIGSAHQARSPKNPFTWEERAMMIADSLPAAKRARVSFAPVRDYYNDHRWAAAVEAVLADSNDLAGRSVGGGIALMGFDKDASTYYLSLFPRWRFHAIDRQGDIDAACIRQRYFAGELEAVADRLPAPVVRFLQDWSRRPEYAALRVDQAAVAQYRQRWGDGPFVTVDAVVTTAQQVLLIRRGSPPGQGLWAVPGGFLEGRERLLFGARRELKEETGLDVPDTALRAVAVFDHPDRSLRARVITHAHWFDLGLETPPPVQGADDAAGARWFPISDLPGRKAECFEDHFHILDHFLKLTT
jgi:bifunctional NMN adenylyltransferase/nudix hydrolase